VPANAQTQATFTPALSATRLEVIDVQDHRHLFLNGHLAARYACDEKGTERVLATQLAGVLSLADKEIASAFGIHPVSLSRLRSQARDGGSAALMPRKTGPKGPSKVTAELEGRCRALRGQGLSTRAIAERVSQGKVRISHVTVAELLKEVRSEPRQQPLPLEGQAMVEPMATSVATTPEPLPPTSEPTLPTTPSFSARSILRLGTKRRATRYAGAFLLYAALARLDIWGVFRQLGAETGPARRFGWEQTLATVIFCFALRFRSIEDFKNVRREDLGIVLGETEAPTVLTLRGKIKALAESVDPLSISRELFRRYLSLEPVWEGLYYLDGHFCPYYGQHPTPRGWDAKRRLAVKGHTDVYVHDARGRALFFFSQPLNDSLARAIPVAVEEIRRAHGPGPFTLVFDRGGYSGDAFRFLQEQGIGFITYLKGRQARRRYPRKQFRSGWFRFEGRRHVYRLFEKKTRISRAGSIRTVIFLGDDGHQIPVLTNLSTLSKAAKVVHCLRLRWRQENDFKYLRDNYAIDQIVQYGADQETLDRRIANPRRKALKEQVHLLSQQLQALEAQLGRALDGNDERRRPTARGIKIAHGRLRSEIARKRQALTRLENRLRRTPGQISAMAADKTRSLLREDRRLVVNALKIAALNAEKLLVRRFDETFKQPKDAFSVFRSLLHLPGHIRALGTDCLEVRLDRPDSEKVAHALENLLTDINQDLPRMLGDGPTLRFSVQR
jgi:transposase